MNNPFVLNLEQQKKRAKELLKALNSGDSLAIQRTQSLFTPPKTEFKLADAQHVIANQLGLASWAKLKAHIEQQDYARQKIADKTLAPDVDLKTLHVRCGHDIQGVIKTAGFTGDFLPYFDPIFIGPIAPDLLPVRAKFIEQSFGKQIGKTAAEIQADMHKEWQQLTSGDYQRIVIWAEHDCYDQLVTLRVINELKQTGFNGVLELISINQYPGSARFIGLGQLPAESLWLLWQQRQPISEFAGNIWQAFLAQDTNQLAQLSAPECLPHLNKAIARYIAEQPNEKGLSLTQSLTLQALEAGAKTGGELFSWLNQNDPQPFLGDMMYWLVLDDLLARGLVAVDDVELPWQQRLVSKTAN